MEAFNTPPPRAFGAWHPGKRVQRRLMSPRFIRRYIHRDSDLVQRRAMAQYALARWQEGPIGTRDDEFVVANLMEEQVPSTLPEPGYRLELIRWMEAQHGVKVRRIKHRDRRREQRRIARAALFADSLLEPGQVGAFARGEFVTLPGRDLTFIIGKSGRLGAVGHGCLDIAIKATGGPALGGLCFYVKETPCLDQLAAIALHTNSGTEREILAIGNPTFLTEEGLAHPFIQERRAASLATMIQRAQEQERPEEEPAQEMPEITRAARARLSRFVDPRVLAEDRNEQYWRATRGQWFRTLTVALLGHTGLQYVAAPSSVA